MKSQKSVPQVQLEDSCQRFKFEGNDETLILGNLKSSVHTALAKQPLHETTNLTQTGNFQQLHA